MSNYQQTAKRVAKAAKQQMISSICDELDKVKESNGGILKYGIVSNLVQSYSSAAPHMKITRHDIRNMLEKRTNSRANTTIIAPNNDVALEDPPIIHTVVISTARGNGGRPKGATKEKYVNCKVAIIAEWKKPTGGKVFSAGEVKLGVDILRKMKENKDKLLEKEKAAKESNRIEYAKLVAEAIKSKDMMVIESKTPNDLKNTELKALLKPLRRPGDAAIPTRKKDMIELYEQWKDRTYVEPAEEQTQLVVVSGFEVEDNDESESVEDEVPDFFTV